MKQEQLENFSIFFWNDGEFGDLCFFFKGILGFDGDCKNGPSDIWYPSLGGYFKNEHEHVDASEISEISREWWSPIPTHQIRKGNSVARWLFVGVTLPAWFLGRFFEAWTLAQEKALKEVGVYRVKCGCIFLVFPAFLVGGKLKIFFNFHPDKLGKWSNLTSIPGGLVQPPTNFLFEPDILTHRFFHTFPQLISGLTKSRWNGTYGTASWEKTSRWVLSQWKNPVSWKWLPQFSPLRFENQFLKKNISESSPTFLGGRSTFFT